jgi:hypothetical protein
VWIERDALPTLVVDPRDCRRRLRGRGAIAGEDLRRPVPYWDGSQELGEAFSPLLGIRSRMAWDVYLLFDADAEWKDAPPAPAEWLHQLVGEDPDRELSEERLEEAISKLAR